MVQNHGGFPGDSLISSRKIITMKMRQSLGHFSMKRVKDIKNIYFFHNNNAEKLFSNCQESHEQSGNLTFFISNKFMNFSEST